MSTQAALILTPQQRRRNRVLEGPAPARWHVGPHDLACVEEILALVQKLPVFESVRPGARGTRLRAVTTILEWLDQHPGSGWQERWHRAGADRDTGWLDAIVADDPRAPGTKRTAMTYGIVSLILARVILPGYTFLGRYRGHGLYKQVRSIHRPDLFTTLEQAGADLGMSASQVRDGLIAVIRTVVHTGRDVNELTVEDLHEQRDWYYHGTVHMTPERGLHAGWGMLQHIGVLPREGGTMLTNGRIGQRSVEDLVDYYAIRCGPVRDLLVRYLKERAPGLDYATLHGLAATLVNLFWADLEEHHPGIDTLHLPEAIAEGWKERLRTYTTKNGETRTRKDYRVQLGRIRAFYLDLQEWALHDATWATWAAPSPVRRTDLHGMSKARKATIAEMHQRVRARLPHLARLVESVEDHRLRQAALLEAAGKTAVGGVFEHEGVHYQRTLHKSQLEDPLPLRPETVLVQDAATGELKDVSADEDYAFWTWAVVETLRHTGIRVEELMEITHLAIVSYRLQKTGELVPLLQIVPSKSNEERLLLVSPELASVLAAVVKRLRDENNGKIPLVARYDGHEKTTGPPLPHLFQRKTAWRPSVVSTTLIKRMLDDALTRTGLRDADGQPLRYTPHDFRRMFMTEAVAGGLPVHIAAKLLGHHGLATVESYLAVFQDDLITSYRSFLAKRRAARPAEEYREPTEQEWREFEEHFTQRKLELGTCGRPYGTPCKHEHACIRCPMLRVDPKQRPRLGEIIRNLTDRIEEAQMNGWLGEVEGLNVSLTAAKDKLTSLIRSEERAKAQLGGQPTPLGMPVLGRPKGKTS